MTTNFPSRELALEYGLYYSGSSQKVSELKAETGRSISLLGIFENTPFKKTSAYQKYYLLAGKVRNKEFGVTIPVDMYRVEGAHHPCVIAVETLRDGYGLWLVDGENGSAVRV